MSTAGFPDSTVRESQDPVRAAIRHAGFAFPVDPITVNLAPTCLVRSGDERKHFMSGCLKGKKKS